MRHGSILLFAAAAGVLATPALAQDAKRLRVQLNARAVYDDNVPRSNAALAALRGVEQEDWIFSPSVSIDLQQPIGRQTVFLMGSVGYNFYEKNDELNREQISLRGGVNSVFGPCAFDLSGDVKRQQSQLEDLALGVTKNLETVSSVSLGAACGREVGFVPTASVAQQWAGNSAAQREDADYVSSTASLGIAYRRPTLGELTLSMNYGATDYDRFILTPSGLEKDGYETYGASLRFARSIGARLKGSVSGGYSSAQPSTSNSEEFEGFTYAVDLNYRPTSRLGVQINMSRAVNPSNRERTTYAVEQSYAVEGNYTIGSRIRLGLGGSYVDSTYENDALAGGLSIAEEQTKSIFGSIRFNFSERLAVTLDASRQERDANINSADYTANRVGLSVVATY